MILHVDLMTQLSGNDNIMNIDEEIYRLFGLYSAQSFAFDKRLFTMRKEVYQMQIDEQS